MTNAIKTTFVELSSRYTSNNELVSHLWAEIEKNYSDKKRQYHTLSHLWSLYNDLSLVKNDINDWDTILFSMFYHDIIYSPSRQDNEEKSAEIAAKRLQSIFFPRDKISKCSNQILATKKHNRSDDYDTNLFTDADLNILGQSWDLYSDYCKKIRQEYHIYPDLLYRSGRKKVLNHFLQMEQIFKTEPFVNKYEKQARQNLIRELKTL